jgi:hypothetical protein
MAGSCRRCASARRDVDVGGAIDTVTALLGETETAHGVFETTELKGVYDEDWAEWYAAYAVEHGIGDLIGRRVTADELAGFLSSTFIDFKRHESTSTDGWAAYTARRITTEL